MSGQRRGLRMALEKGERPPTLALYLLGYEVKKAISSTNLQECRSAPSCAFSYMLGVLGCPRSCLHAILSLLQRGSERRSGPVVTSQAPHLAELCYQHLPFILPSDEISALSQMSWLMKDGGPSSSE
ncbi:hypothetical protein J4Q44_G00113070 [Coregonus suidteri]|uniref:Uncharacterized protein n=1 Tax=Coregonus suidteri TaxID=861788 RepID=A0AAN8MKI1_9TELE